MKHPWVGFPKCMLEGGVLPLFVSLRLPEQVAVKVPLGLVYE